MRKALPRQSSLLLPDFEQIADDDARAGPIADARESPEDLFASHCRMYGLPQVERQLAFAKAAMGRNWRFDFAWREYMVAVEIQGVVVRRIQGVLITSGGHSDVQGMRKDHEKQHAAILLGWTVVPFMQTEIKPRRAIEMTARILTARGWSQGQ